MPSDAQGVEWVVMISPTVIGKMQLDEYRTSVAIFESSKVYQCEAIRTFWRCCSQAKGVM